MRSPACIAMLVAGSAGTLVAGLVWLARATIDAGEPLPLVHVLTVVGPLLLAAGIVTLRLQKCDGKCTHSSASSAKGGPSLPSPAAER